MAETAVYVAPRRVDWTGIAFAVVLSIVIIFPLIVVGTWAFTNVWRYPAVIPQEFGLRYWNQTLARPDVWQAITTSVELSVVVTAISARMAALGAKPCNVTLLPSLLASQR